MNPTRRLDLGSNRSQTSPKQASRPSQDATITRKSLFVALLLAMQSGFPLALLGQPIQYAIALVAFFIFCFTILGILTRPLSGLSVSAWGITGLVGYYFVQSFVSNTFIFSQGANQWVLSIYVFFPLLVIWPFGILKIEVRDVINGTLIAAVFVSILLFVDQKMKFSFLEAYIRVAFADDSLRRVVLLKNEVAFSFVIIFAKLININTRGRILYLAISLAFVGYCLLILQESRLAIASALIGCFLYLFFFFKSDRKLIYIGLIFLASAITLPFLLNKYYVYAVNIGDFSSYDPSVSMRLIEREYFEWLFDKTSGIGIGQMSLSPEKDNVLSIALTNAAALYGKKGAQMGIADLGYFGALYQFGYIGLCLAFFFTGYVIVKLARYGKNTSNADHVEIAALVCAFIGFQINPLPLNIFSLDWAVMSGGVFWYIAAKVGEATRAAVPTKIETRLLRSTNFRTRQRPFG